MELIVTLVPEEPNSIDASTYAVWLPRDAKLPSGFSRLQSSYSCGPGYLIDIKYFTSRLSPVRTLEGLRLKVGGFSERGRLIALITTTTDWEFISWGMLGTMNSVSDEEITATEPELVPIS